MVNRKQGLFLLLSITASHAAAEEKKYRFQAVESKSEVEKGIDKDTDKDKERRIKLKNNEDSLFDVMSLPMDLNVLSLSSYMIDQL